MRCPACRSPLVVVERDEIELDWCAACRGLWFDEGELELLGEKAGRSIDVADLGRRAGRVVGGGRRRCPRCSKPMERLALPASDAEQVVVDRCRRHGFWLDRGELGTIVRRLETSRGSDEGLVLEFLGETFVDRETRSNSPEGRSSAT